MPYRRTSGRAILAAIAATLMLVLAACGSDESQPAEAEQAAAGPNPELQGEITLGAVLPLTGASATIGADQQRGIELAVEEINRGEGVLGKKIAVTVEDSQGEAAASVSAARKLVTVDKAPVVIGEYSSGNTIPVGEYLQGADTVHINPGSSSSEIANIGDFSMSTIGLETIAGKFTAQALLDAGYRKAAYLAPNNAYGTGLLEKLQESYEGAGGTIVEPILYTEGRSDYRQELQRLKDADADIIIYTAYGTEAATINTQAFQLGMDPSKFFGIYLTMCTADSEAEAVEGQYGMDVNFIGPNGEGYQKAYQAKYDQEFATSFSGYTYDAVMMAAEAINRAGSADPAKIRDALKEVGDGYQGVTGEITFDADGQRMQQPYLLATMKDGELVQTDLPQAGA